VGLGTFAARLAGGALTPLSPAVSERLSDRREGESIVLREVTPSELRSERQLRYWFGVVIPVFADQWEREKGRQYPKECVHSALMAAFGGGPVETPLGPSYPPSKFKSRAEFARIVDDAREYAWHAWGVNIPTPGEEGL